MPTRKLLQNFSSLYPLTIAARRVALGYFFLSVVWILATDRVMMWLNIQDGEAGFWFSASKGAAFVGLSTFFIYWLVQRSLQSTKNILGLLGAVVTDTTDAVFIKDLDGRYLFANQAVSNFVKKPVEQILGRTDFALFCESDAKTITDIDRRIIAAGVVKTEEETLHFEGKPRIYSAMKAPFRDSMGRTIGVIGVSRDITAKRQSDELIRQSETRLRLFLEHAPAPIAMLDAEMRYLYVSQRWLTDYDLEGIDVIGRSHYEVFPEIPERWREIHRRCLAGAVERCDADPFKRADGSIQWLRWEVLPWYTPEEKVGGLLIFTEDITSRRKADEEIREQHHITQAILDASSDPIFLKDKDGRYLAVNAAMASLMGEAEEKIIGADDAKFVPPEVAEMLRIEDKTALTMNGPFVSQRDIPVAGEVRHFSVSKNACRDSDGTLIGIVGIGRDLTPRIRYEENLRRSEERYRTLVEVLATPVFVNENGKISFCNPAFVRLVGAKSEDEVLGRSPLEFIHPDFHPLVRKRIETVLATRKTIGGAEIKVLRLDKTVVPVHSVATPIDARPGSPLLVIFSDLTERERNSELLRSILSSVKDAIITIDKRGAIRSANAATESMFGYPLSDLIGRNIEVLIPGGHGAEHGSYSPENFEGEISKIVGVGCEVEARAKDGAKIPVELRVTQFWADGEPHFAGVFRDISEKKRLEDQFRQAQKMEAVGRLAGGVAHDFNNLLTVINGYCDLMLRKIPGKDALHGPLSSVRDAGERAAALTSQLLAFSRRTIVEPKVLNLNPILEHTGKLLRRLIGEDIVVTLLLDPQLSLVKADMGQIDQLVMNLAVNARDAMPKGGNLRIETRNVYIKDHEPGDSGELASVHSGWYSELKVSDTGMGMTEDVKSRIFEPFFTTKPEGKGTGLGLAVVYGVVQQSGGHISVESTPGAGTTFRILLPVAEGTQDSGDSAAEQAASAGTETLLLVEDEPKVRDIAKIALENAGYTVLEAASAPEAAKIYNQRPDHINLLITDVVMPVMSGRELVEELRKKTPQLRVLFMSGYTDDAMVRDCVNNLSDGFIQKPFSPMGLAKKVRETLDRAG